MVVSCWSAKGGSGTTVVAVSLALVLASRPGSGALLVDLAGDAPAVLGSREPDGPGVAEWSRAGADAPADALARLEVPVRAGLDLLPRGQGALDAGRLELLGPLLAADHRAVVVDCGTVGGPDAPTLPVAAGAGASLLVTRLCYLGLRRAAAAPIRPSAVVVVAEPGRALDRADVEGVLGVPIAAEVAVDAAVARAVDAGLLARRLPRGLERALRSAA